MCNFFSGIVTKNKFLWHKDIDGHEDILAHFRKEAIYQDILRDDTKDSQFIRVEILPQNSIWNHNLSTWRFQVDQDLIPDWFNEDKKKYEKIGFKALQECLDNIFIAEGVKNVIEGRWYAYGSATVKAYESATVEAYESATVEASGFATVIVTRFSNKVDVSISENAVVINRKTMEICYCQDDFIIKNIK